MSKERMFSLKVLTNGQAALKESTNRHTSGNQCRSRVIYALDSELRLVVPSVLHDGVFVSASAICERRGISLEEFLNECLSNHTSLYYSLNEMNYVCVHNVVEENGVVKKNTTNLFLPVNFQNEALICNDVSVVFPIQNRTTLAVNYLPYARSRIV